MKNILISLLIPVYLALPNLAYAQTPMMRRGGLRGYPYYGGGAGMMQGLQRTNSPWSGIFVGYHIIIALLFLIALILFIVMLWKKIQMMDNEVVVKKEVKKKE